MTKTIKFLWHPVKSRDDLPKDEQFLVLWRGAISLCEYDEDCDQFCICNYPSEYETTMKVPKDRENKFTHFMLLDRPEDY